MRVISNAMMWQMEVVQKNRWAQGPLELAFIKEPPTESSPLGAVLGPEAGKFPALQFDSMIFQWNQSASGGWMRGGDIVDYFETLYPGLNRRENPNLIFVPQRSDGLTQLHVMLSSLLPDSTLRRMGIPRKPAGFELGLVGIRLEELGEKDAIEAEFSRYIWKKIAPAARLSASYFSPSSPLRLLAGDTCFWMHRLYRLAMQRREELFPPVAKDEETWRPLSELRAAVLAALPEPEREQYDVRRPLYGGDIWNENDSGERAAVLDEAINGLGVMDSLSPVIELLHTRRAHEDFSNRYSWIKEDFERQFYSKRAALKVELIETLDEAPVWSSEENEGYGRILFRDVLAWLDRKERKLFLALRMGRTASEIATSTGLAGHASISRRIARLKQKISRLLDE
jgi:hypothetical protein